jgi:diacylglycerol kinase
MKPPHNSLWASFGYAGAGVLFVLRTQRNFRIHLAFALAAMGMGIGLGLSRLELALLVLTIGLVLTAEIVNTAAETLVDLASPEYHPLAKLVKDLAAGAVLVAAGVAVVVGLLLLGPPLLLWIG